MNGEECEETVERVSHIPGLGLHPGEQLGGFEQGQLAKTRLLEKSP